MAVKTNNKNGKVIKGTSKADKITNTGNKVTIVGGKGNDSIYNGSWNDSLGASVLINSDAGNDTIENDGDNVTIMAGNGNDLVYNYGSKSLFVYGGGNDYIFNGGENVSILAGKGNDTIINGDNTAFNGNNATIDGGAGDDIIDNSWGKNVLIKYSGGNDSIGGMHTDFYANSTLQIATGTMNSVITTNGSDLFLSVGKSTMTLSSAVDYADKLNIIDAKGKAVKYKLNKKIVGNKGNDDIFNSLIRATISSGAGDDTIRNWKIMFRLMAVRATIIFMTIEATKLQSTVVQATIPFKTLMVTR